jgi:hypothetical protein
MKNVRAFGCEPLRRRQPDAAIATDDERDLSFELYDAIRIVAPRSKRVSLTTGLGRGLTGEVSLQPNLGDLLLHRI